MIIKRIPVIISNIVLGFSTFLFNIITGKVSFPKDRINMIYQTDNEEYYKSFRDLKVSFYNENKNNYTVFRVRFKFKNLKPDTNKRLSFIPAPFLIGMKGFRQKVWTINEKNGDFQGIYQWATENHAKNYPDSFIFKVMTKRAKKGTVVYEVIPNCNIDKLLKVYEKPKKGVE